MVVQLCLLTLGDPALQRDSLPARAFMLHRFLSPHLGDRGALTCRSAKLLLEMETLCVLLAAHWGIPDPNLAAGRNKQKVFPYSVPKSTSSLI